MTEKLLFLDCETTGLDKKKCAIHQLSGFVIIDNKIVESFDFKIRPFEGAVIDKEALEINDLKEEDLFTESYIEQSLVYNKLIKIFDKYINKYDKTDKFFLVGYNVHFDKDFLYEFFVRNNNNYLFSYIWGNHIDVMVLATLRLKDRRFLMTDFKQGTVAKVLGMKIDEGKLHDSLYDIIICIGIYSIIVGTEFITDKNISKTTSDEAFQDFYFSSTIEEKSAEDIRQEIVKSNLQKTFTFGKYKGKTVEEVITDDISYIIWCFENCPNQKIIHTELYNYAKQVLRETTPQKSSSRPDPKVIDDQLDNYQYPDDF